MTPKEKATWIVHQMYGALFQTNAESTHVKQCALIAVDEIISSRKDDAGFDDFLSSRSSEYYTPHPLYLTYWEEVKKQIEKL